MAGSEPLRTWEYLTVPEADRERLDELGAAGWDLVAVSGSVPPLLYLKRPGLTFRERVTLDQRETYLAMRGTGAPSQTGGASGE